MSKGNKIVIGLLLFIIIGSAVILILNDKGIIELCKSCKCEPNCSESEATKNESSIVKLDIEALEKEIQDVYKADYDALVEGEKARNYEDCIPFGENSKICALKEDLLKTIFTDNAIYYIHDYFSNYSNNKYYLYNEGFMSTIWGLTDQGVRTLKYVTNNDGLYIFKADIKKCEATVCTPDFGGEYIGFKKVNDKWLVEFFQ